MLVAASAVTALFLMAPRSATAQTSGQEHLARALHLADLYNWVGAASDFAAAEEAFTSAGDKRNALYAHLGRIRANIERDQRSLPTVSADLADLIETDPILRADKQLLMFAWIVKGDIDGETDTGSMKSDWKQVQSLAAELGDTKWQYRSVGQLGIAAFYDGDTETASKNVGMVLQAAVQNRDVGAQVRFLTVLGFGLAETNMYEQAIPMFEKALALAGSVPDYGYAFTERSALLAALVGMKQYGRAQTLADEILQRAQQEGRTSREVETLARIASIQLAQGERTAAVTTLTRAMTLAESAGLLRALAAMQAMAAQMYVQAGDAEKAEELLAAAATASQSGGDLYSLPQRLALLAEIRIKQAKFNEADDAYDRAEAFIDAMLGKGSTVLQKTALIRAASDIYSSHFALVAERLADPDKAYKIIERARGRAINDMLMAGVKTSPEAHRADRAVARLRLALMSARSTAEVQRLRDKIFIAEQARWSTPSVSVVKRQSTSPAELKTVQDSLPSGTVMLEYVLAGERSYCLVISKEDTRVVALVPKAAIEREVRAYLAAVERKQAGYGPAKRLYSALLQPIQEAKENKNLVIVRDGLLHMVPFDAFVSSSGRYVISTKNVTYAPSATTFQLLSSEAADSAVADREFLGVAAIPYATSGLNRSPLTRGKDRSAFHNLPGSREEVSVASNAVGRGTKTLLLGRKGTERAFKNADLAHYKKIHLAVHGTTDPAFPDRAALILLSDPSAGEDGFLQASEIAQLRLNADLVVLSACDTAVGPLQGQEGIAALSRAFLMAGARTVVSTLWQIDDNASLFVMRRFYARLAAGASAEEALRRAKLDFIKSLGANAFPYYWAGYTLEGAVGQDSRSGGKSGRASE